MTHYSLFDPWRDFGAALTCRPHRLSEGLCRGAGAGRLTGAGLCDRKGYQATEIDVADAATRLMAWLVDSANPALTEVI